MGSPYTSQSVSGYNANPPSDDGAATEANRGKWATIKTKLGDPLNAYAAAQNSALVTAFGKIPGGAGITSTAINLTVQLSDQGKVVRASAGGIVITTPDATSVGSPFVFTVLNDATSDITVDGSGSQTIDGDASVTLPPNTGLTLETDGSNWFSWGQNFQRTPPQPQGYLTLVAIASGALSPIPGGDVAAATAVYYRPYRGNLLPVPNGTLFKVIEFTEMTLTLAAQHLASSIYDVFAFEDPGAAGTYRLGTGPAWTTVTAGSGARGTGAGTTELFVLKGLMVNTVAITLRNGSSTYSVGVKSAVYLGSIYMDGTNGQASCHVTYGQSRKWSVWNAFNRQKIVLRAGDATASWTPGNSIGSTNASALNVATCFTGLGEEWVHATYHQGGTMSASGSTSTLTNGIGLNSTAAATGKTGRATLAAAGADSWAGEEQSSLRLTPTIGINNLNMLETGTGTRTHLGGIEDCVMEVVWLG